MQLLHPLSTDSACQLLKSEHHKNFVGIKKNPMQLRITYVFHYPGQFIILEYYFSNQNTKEEHIPLAFLQMQANTFHAKKKKITFPNFLKLYILGFITIPRKQI